MRPIQFRHFFRKFQGVALRGVAASTFSALATFARPTL
jgi:hypothetical protein